MELSSGLSTAKGRITTSYRPGPLNNGSLFQFAVTRIRLLLADRHPLRSIVAYLAGSCAIHLHRSSCSIWVHGEEPEQFYAAEELLRAIKSAAPQNRFLLTSTRPATLERLAARFPSDLVLPAPWNLRWVTARFFASLYPRMIILLESDEGFSPHALTRAAKANVPIVAINVGDRDGESAGNAFAVHMSDLPMARLCVQDGRTASILHARGLPEDRLSVTGTLEFECASPADPADQAYIRSELRIRADAPVIIAEKIRSKDEGSLIDLFARLRSSYPNLVMLIEPEYRRQIPRIIAALGKMNVIAERRSYPVRRPDVAVLILDIPGELPGLHGIALYVFGPAVPPQADVGRLLLAHDGAIQGLRTQPAHAADELIQPPGPTEPPVHQATHAIVPHQGATQRTYHAIESLIPKTSDDRPVNQGWRIKARVDRIGETAVGKRLLHLWMKRRIETWESLKDRLGHPQAILCLGNGPSSEHPQLGKMAHDALFRVNWRWKTRGLLAHPDLVFVGDPRTFKQLSSCIFAFDKAWESFMLVRRLVLLRPGPIDYFTLDLSPSFIDQPEWYARPTNGAMMIVTAAALQPERLIIAGVDLYLHPEGRYPGDFRSCNQYSQVHSRAVELEVIRRALRTYRGEVVILSDHLRQSLDRLRDRAPAPR